MQIEKGYDSGTGISEYFFMKAETDAARTALANAQTATIAVTVTAGA